MKKTELAALRGLPAAARAKALIGTRSEIEFQIDRGADIDKEARTAWMSIASEEPYERWWGVETLVVSKTAIDDTRLKMGAPLLVDHRTSDQVGVVERYEITPAKKLRILARFSKSARGEEIWQDVLDGIRRCTSVAYLIDEIKLKKSEGDLDFYDVTKWTPLEGSIVAVPADITVGVGRALDPADAAPQPQRTEMTPEEKAKYEAEVRAKVEAELRAEAEKKALAAANDPATVLKREQDRVSGILAAGEEFKDLGGTDLARELVKDATATVETFKVRMFEKMRGKQKPTTTAEPGNPSYGSGARQIIRHGTLRAFTKPLHFTDGSKMEPVEAAYRSGQWLLATVGNQERAQRWCREHGLAGFLEQRVMTTDVGSAGGFLVPDEMEQSIIDLREAYGLARRLARRRPMASDTKSVPKRTGGVTAYFINEDNDGVTASDKGWGQVNFVAKLLGALSLISSSLEEDAIIDVVDDLAQEQAYAFAAKEDACWLIGDGTSTYGGMVGLLTLFNGATYASGITAASNHDTFAEYDSTDLSAVMAGVADIPGLNPSWVASKTFAENVFGRLKRTAGGNTGDDLDRRYKYGYGGYPADTSELMPKDGTQAVTTVEALFGDFSKSSSFADRRGIMVQVLRERYAEKFQVGILGSERFQVVNHDLGTSAVKGPVAALKGQ